MRINLMKDDVVSFSIAISSAVRLSQAQIQHIPALSDNLMREASFTALIPRAEEIRLTDAQKKKKYRRTTY